MRIFTAREKGFVLGQANEDLKSFTECEAGGARTNKEICKYVKIPPSHQPGYPNVEFKQVKTRNNATS